MNDEMTVRELVDRLYAAAERMSRKNSHRALMLHACSALMQLAQQVRPPEPEKIENRVELVTLQ